MANPVVGELVENAPMDPERAVREARETGADRAFELAREQAFAGNYDAAREIAYEILERSPGYHDVRVLAGRTLAWEGRRDEARVEFSRVLDEDPAHRDAFRALFDVEMWDGDPQRATAVIDRALRAYPDDPEFLVRKARALSSEGRRTQATAVLDRVDRIQPGYEDSEVLRESIRTSWPRPNSIAAGFTYDRYSTIFQRDPISYVQYGRQTTWGSAIVRINYRDRFGDSGTQQEIDLYPGFGGGHYGYLNYGYSDNFLFPTHRIGAEYYRNLSHGFEASAGFRHLRFSGGSVTMYTGSVSRYHGSYFFSIRPLVTPDSQGTSVSSRATVRRYFRTADNYIELTGGAGRSVQERQFQSPDSQGVTLRSWSAGIGAHWEVFPNYFLSGSFTYSEQALVFSPDDFVGIQSFGLGLEYRF